MYLRTACGLALAYALIAVSTAAIADVNDSATERRLSIPASARAIVMPREDWVLLKEQRRPGDTAVYYMLTSQQRQMVFSVYIDRTEVCRSADSCLDAAMANSQYKDARELRRSELNQFKVAQFFSDNPQGAPIKQAQVSASAYVDGHWYDVHISKSAAERPDLAPLLDFLKTIAIK